MQDQLRGALDDLRSVADNGHRPQHELWLAQHASTVNSCEAIVRGDQCFGRGPQSGAALRS